MSARIITGRKPSVKAHKQVHQRLSMHEPSNEQSLRGPLGVPPEAEFTSTPDPAYPDVIEFRWQWWEVTL